MCANSKTDVCFEITHSTVTKVITKGDEYHPTAPCKEITSCYRVSTCTNFIEGQ